MWHKFLLSVALAFCSSSISVAGEKLSLVTAQWDKYTNLDGTGLYFDIINEIFPKQNYSAKLVPWARAQKEFQSGKIDMLLGETSDMEYCNYPKYPVDAEFFAAYFLKSKIKSLPKMKDFNKYSIVWVRGYQINKYAPEITKFQEVDDVNVGLKLVSSGKADILIDYLADMKEFIAERKLDKNEHLVVPTTISGGYIYLCFLKTEEGNKLRDQFDNKMSELMKNGKIESLFNKYNRKNEFEKLKNALK